MWELLVIQGKLKSEQCTVSYKESIKESITLKNKNKKIKNEIVKLNQKESNQEKQIE